MKKVTLELVDTSCYPIIVYPVSKGNMKYLVCFARGLRFGDQEVSPRAYLLQKRCAELRGSEKKHQYVNKCKVVLVTKGFHVSNQTRPDALRTRY